MASSPGPSSANKPASVDPVLRNTLRYTISAREYATLHKYILSRSKTLRRAAPTPASVDKALQPQQPQQKGQKGTDDYNAKAVRHALRVFLATMVGIKGWEAISKKLGDGRGHGRGHGPSKQPSRRFPALRLSASLSSILLLYRFLFRFFSRLRAHLLDPQIEPFRRRNPRTVAALTSPYAPAVGASLAGVALGVYPSQQLRASVAIYAMFRALEFAWNMCESGGLVWGLRNGKKRERPWWFGSWLLQPLAFGQLLHAVVLDRDCFPAAYGNFIFKHSDGYIHPSPPEPWSLDGHARARWPSTTDVVESLAQMARLNWPPYISPTMFPDKEEVLPASVKAVSPLTSRAHPLITSLSCATLHPDDPSCSRTYLTFWLASFPSVARFFLVVYSAATIVPRPRALYDFPVTTVRNIISRALRTSTFATGAISTAWASICFFQNQLPGRLLATQRFFLGGFLAGLWAWVERRHGRAIFLSSARVSVDSLWKVGVKRRWWRAVRGGDVCVFVLALMLTGVVYERDASAIREARWRKGFSWVRGEGWRDWAIEEDDEDAYEEKKRNEDE